MKKVLIIAYYWPPAGGGGVQRWVKFTKYLRDFGWEPVLFIPEDADYPIYDDSLSKDIPADIEIIRQKIWEPYSIYSKLLNRRADKKVSVGLIDTKKNKKSLISNVLLWVRGNLFIPDARKFWIRPSVRSLKKYLKKNKIDVVATTGPPHSVHLIGLKLKRALNIKWVADFRDPWVYMDNYIEDFKFTDRTLKKHIRLEADVLTEADRVITVTQKMVDDYLPIRDRDISLITNGFDHEDFDLKKQAGDKFIIGHYGTLGKYRNPTTLFKVLSDLCNEDAEFSSKLLIQLIGPVDYEIFDSITENGLDFNLQRVDYVPHQESIQKMVDASILLLLLDKNVTMKGRMTGKIFEYLAAKNTILGQGSLESDPVKVLKETGAGKMIEYEDYNGIKSFILEQYKRYMDVKRTDANDDRISQYSRRVLTSKLATLLNEVI